MMKQHIMAIDDDMEMLKQLAIMLNEKYSVSVMTSAEQAIERLSEGDKPDLILLDVMMPETDGFSMIKHLQQNPEMKSIPVIFLTGMTDAENEVRGLSLGGADYIRKPFNREVLLARIAVCLANHPAKAEGLSPEICEKLTDNEIKVAELLYRGYSGKECSDELFFSYSYIKKLIASIREKLGADSISELTRKLHEG